MEDSSVEMDSEKLDFLSHPAFVVLSIWERMQSYGLMKLLWISIQMEITEATNSRVFMWALPIQSIGSWNLQTLPEYMLYPPRPYSQVSDNM